MWSIHPLWSHIIATKITANRRRSVFFSSPPPFHYWADTPTSISTTSIADSSSTTSYADDFAIHEGERRGEKKRTGGKARKRA